MAGAPVTGGCIAGVSIQKHVPVLRLGCVRRARQDTRRKSGSATIANSRMARTAASAEGSAMAFGSAERAAALAA